MARLILPTAIDAVSQLLADVRQKNLDLGTDSPITALLVQQGINLAADATALQAAKAHDLAAAALRSQSENYTALRNLKSEPVLKTVSGIGQVLKTFYKPSYTEVALWGIDITATGKISYPSAATDQDTLVKAIRQKNGTYAPGASPLAPYLAKEAIDPDTLAAAMADAVQFDNQATQNRNEAQNEIELRNQKMAPVVEHLRTIGAYLMDFYSDNPRQLGLWGFLVDENAQKPAEQVSKIKLLNKLTINSVVIGGGFTNIGETEVHLYKGKTTVGNPIILAPGEVFGIPKGFSTLTVSNPSPLKTAVIKVLVRK